MPLMWCALVTGCTLLAAGCSGVARNAAPAVPTTLTAAELAAACPPLSAASVAQALPVVNTTIASAAWVAPSATAPEHCQLDGEINRRTGADGKSYAIRFRMRMPAAWNGRFFMGGGGGTNGTVVDPVARAWRRATRPSAPTAGTTTRCTPCPPRAAPQPSGCDPQARIDFAYNAYDVVTRVGKALVQRFYSRPANHAYFMGCSEGGREGLLMTQRFPQHYDGVVSGDPVLHLPLGPMSGVFTTQLFAGLAKRSDLTLANGRAGDQQDLLRHRPDADAHTPCSARATRSTAWPMASSTTSPACTKPLVSAKFAALTCSGAKTDTCLSADQIATMLKAFDGTFDSRGKQLYADWQWDAGIGGLNGSTYNPSWRSWWLGSFASATPNAIKLNFATALAVAYTTPPQVVATADSLAYSLAYNFDTEPGKLYTTSGAFTQSAAQLYFADSTDLEGFKARRGKLMVYHGASDSSVSVNDTLRWYQDMNRRMGADTPSFARMYIVPGMGHCSGGPATDSFDMLPQLVEWVEKGVAPDRVVAKATNPGYFGVAARTRPLCVYPKQTRYNGAGDINDAANFSCR